MKTTGFLDAEPSFGGVAAQSLRVDEDMEGEAVTPVAIRPHRSPLGPVTVVDMGHPGLFPPIAFIFRRAALDVVGLYAADVLGAGDWDFHMRFLEHFAIGTLPKPLAFWHARRRIKGGDYGNSNYDTAGTDLWRRNATLAANNLICRDIRSGQLGMGLIAALVRGHDPIDACVSRT